ncbi:PAS domain S-box protein [Hymenobacter weizhouensis]|uniref:PAS domain S-box protein n=1 Tax=Hymenobacter sp. YIM 151500-1 TaxID=2987689 RepID=UPI002227B58C|nr:PAS domain S-box protein [Hymenobacter sp. YIM 151500-1]UYZ64655.1 PAS domain S-box protein [Hymenobacter sp. YIM 151500-1]
MTTNDPSESAHPYANPHEALRDLRQQAERRQLVTQGLPADVSAEVQRLVQELQVHQIELEMQYEELLLAQVDAETSRARYVDLYEFAPVGYCSLRPDGTIEQLNLRASQLLGTVRQHLLGRRLALFVNLTHRTAFADFVQAVLTSEQRQTTVLEMRRDDGTPFVAHLEGTVAPNPAHLEEPRCNLALLDITEQHRTQQALALSEQRFRTLFEANSDGMLLMRDNRFANCNQAALHLLALPDKSRLLGQPATAFSPEIQPGGQHSAVLAEAYWQQALRIGHCRFEWVRLRSTGEELWTDILLTVIPETGSNSPLVHATWRDITEPKRAAALVRESQERLRDALQASAMGVIDWNLTTDQLYWDERAQAIFGHPFRNNPVPSEEVLARVHPDDQGRLLELITNLRPGQTALETEYRVLAGPDEAVRHVTMTGRVLTDEARRGGRLLGLVRDITARREAEQELSYKNRLLEHIVANMPVVLGRLSPQGEYLELVGQGLRRVGVQDNQLVGRSVFDVFPTLIEPTRQLLAGQQINFLGSAEYQGQAVYFQNYGFFDQQRQQGVVFAIDVTESEQRRLQLQHERDLIQGLLAHSVDGIIALDAQGRVLAWNQAAERLSGLAAGQVLGLSLPEVSQLLGQPAPDALQALVERVLGGEDFARLGYYSSRSGGVWLDLYARPLPLPEGAGALLVLHDVTEQTRLQAEATQLKVRQQQLVLEAVLKAQEEERRRIAESLHNGVGQLLYATKLSMASLAPTEPVQASQRLLEEAIRATRTISFELTPGILADFGLEAALQDLVKRIPPHQLAVDLNLHGLQEPLPATLQIALYRMVQELLNNVMKHAQAREVFVEVSRADGQVYVCVEDDGVGFEPEHVTQSRQGLGLASIRSRVELLGGTLSIRSRPGHGTGISFQAPVPAPSPPGNEPLVMPAAA